MWDYNDPGASETRLQEALSAAQTAGDRGYSIELMTQVARAQGLQRRFDDAQATLDKAETNLSSICADDRSGPRPRPAADDPRPREGIGRPDVPSAPGNDFAAARIRLLLERGRVLNSSGHPADAQPLFEQAWERARRAGIDGLAVDAAHMVAIVDPEHALAWNEKALALAESSDEPDARRWKGSLHNNIGWTYHERGVYETALGHFQAALACRIEEGKPEEIGIARWCIARCLRSLGRVDEALTMQRELEREHAAAGRPDGYVSEEIAECLLATGKPDEARPYFRKAHEILSQDPWLLESEPERIKRLGELGG